MKKNPSNLMSVYTYKTKKISHVQINISKLDTIKRNIPLFLLMLLVQLFL